jgi:hypothetical protein
VDTGWLSDVIARLERCPELLERLDVVVSDLAIRRGGRVEVPQGPNRVISTSLGIRVPEADSSREF